MTKNYQRDSNITLIFELYDMLNYGDTTINNLVELHHLLNNIIVTVILNYFVKI